MKRLRLVLIPLAMICLTRASSGVRAHCTGACSGSLPTFSSGSLVTLYSFAGSPDGASPQAGLIGDAAGNFYGTTVAGGSSHVGTVFKLAPSGETVLHSFSGQDGANPQADLILDAAGNLYGTTLSGGDSNAGTVFRLDPSGKETVLYSFTGGPDGSRPSGSLVRESSGSLYGTTLLGGANGNGTVFELTRDGKEKVLHSFSGGTTDGANPSAGLAVDAAGIFYGTTSGGGTSDCVIGGSASPSGCGTVFKLDPTGVESVLYSFVGKNDGPDGAVPGAGLLRDAHGNLYGTTLQGGTGSGPCYTVEVRPGQPPANIYCGTVFKLDSAGSETVLHWFTGGSDGASPHAHLVSDAAGSLYGTTFYGGTGHCVVTGGFSQPVEVGCGTVFEVDSSGTETVLYDFTGARDGQFPQAGLVLDKSGNLYGTTTEGGSSNEGTIFKFTPATTRASSTLSVTLAGNGSGTVTSDPAGLDCGTACSASFSDGTTVTLTATAAMGSTFSDWSGACTGAGTCAVTVSGPQSVTATFDAAVPSDFSLTPTFTDLTIEPGARGTDTITVTPLNGPFAEPIQLSCSVSGTTPAPSCSLSPASVTPGAESAISVLSISVPNSALQLVRSTGRDRRVFIGAVSLSLCLVAFSCAGLLWQEASRWKLLSGLIFGLFCVAMLSVAGCSGSPRSNPNHPASRLYTVTVRGVVSGGVQHSTQITVNVP
jgi:uncharacterized repeat protein (TIGR03803 family)